MKADIKLDDTRVFVEGDRVSVGVTDPQFKMDVGDRLAVRQGASPSAGIWFLQNDPQADHAFIGMESDHSVGFWAHKPAGGGPGWAVVMDTTTGDLDVRANLEASKVSATAFFLRVPMKLPGMPDSAAPLMLDVNVWEAIQKLNATVDSLKAEIEALKKSKK